ncbi:zinc finger BED domain-containing protein RICESLEEPER 1-like [Prunus yedoensis var. nudiflora]|uniref:Zinc finger BED domain-containing protein RICESLEEPER 1-like n=1 Tax=Prunus yedoensis var. nudiflora TaxID=2094558 RepID=A0A314XV02_PRUYE|nr:zinc finger BED domain-containing protein RICESLEEPER 1-like [Prunus yedoensis var. nudiflora]
MENLIMELKASIVGSNDGNSIPSDPDTEENDEGSKNDMEEALGELAMFMCCVGLVPFKVVEDMFFLNLGYKLVEYDEQKTLRALADFVCSVDFPPQLLNHITFRKLANRLNPLFNLTYGMVRSECIKVYEERKWSIKEYLGNLDGQISLSVDVLGYENVCNFCCYDYVCLSAHFIDENWKLRKWVLYFRCLWDPSVNCSEDCGIFKFLEDLEIADKISTLATSNDHRYAKMFEYVKTHVQEKRELQLSGQLFNVYCFGEIISQMVVDAFHKIRDLIDRVGELYSSKSLPLWYLTSSNLKQALELWSMGEFSSKDVTDSYDVPSPEEWKIVEGWHEIFWLFRFLLQPHLMHSILNQGQLMNV